MNGREVKFVNEGMLGQAECNGWDEVDECDPIPLNESEKLLHVETWHDDGRSIAPDTGLQNQSQAVDMVKWQESEMDICWLCEMTVSHIDLEQIGNNVVVRKHDSFG